MQQNERTEFWMFLNYCICFVVFCRVRQLKTTFLLFLLKSIDFSGHPLEKFNYQKNTFY